MHPELIRTRVCSEGPRKPSRWLPRGGSRWTLRGLLTDVVLYHYPHRGFYPHLAKDRSGGHQVLFTLPEFGASVMKKRVLAEGVRKGGSKALVSCETKVWGKFPNVLAHVAEIAYDDGTTRKAGTLNIRTLGTSWQITAKDPDSSAQIVALGTTVDDAMLLLDKLLGAEDAPWELDPYAQGGKRRK